MSNIDIESILKQLDGGQTKKVDLRPYVSLCKKNWKKILKYGIIGMIVGILLALSIPKTYSTTAIVAPELTTRTTTGLSSLANLAGINMNAMAVTDAMHTDLYPTILKSSSFISSLFNVKVHVKDRKDGVIETDFYDYVTNHVRQPWFSYIFSAPHLLGDLFRKWFSKEPEEADGYAELNQTDLTREQMMVIKYTAKNITATVDKKTYSIKITVKMQDQMVCAEMANAVIRNLESFVKEYRTRKARHNLAYYEKVKEEARLKYLEAQHEYAQYVDEHQSIYLQSTMVERDRLMNEANLLYQVYNQLSQQAETGKAKVEEEAPVLVVIQPGVKPLQGSPSKVKIGILFFFIGCLVSLLFIYKENE